MPRVARIVIPGLPHHITQRGNNPQDVFFVDDDRRTYLALLKEQSERFGLVVVAYRLMDNHVHLVATPSAEESLARAQPEQVSNIEGFLHSRPRDFLTGHWRRDCVVVPRCEA